MRHFGSRSRAFAAALLAALLYARPVEAATTLDADGLARQVHTLSSISAEAAFFTQELRAGHLRPSFAAVHLRNLIEDTAKARQEIAKPAAGPVEDRRIAAETLALQLAQALLEIAAAHTGDHDRLAHERSIVLRLKSEFDALEPAP